MGAKGVKMFWLLFGWCAVGFFLGGTTLNGLWWRLFLRLKKVAQEEKDRAYAQGFKDGVYRIDEMWKEMDESRQEVEGTE